MLKELRLDTDAPWKQLFRLPITSIGQIAPSRPTRGLAVSNRSSTYQLYAWRVSTDEFSQLTERPEGVACGIHSPDGAFVYCIT
jgi:hypothetical protein